MRKRFYAYVYDRPGNNVLTWGPKLLKPIRWGKDKWGGPSFAQFDVGKTSQELIWDIASSLRAPVLIWDAIIGEFVWWGFLNGIRAQIDPDTAINVSLEGMVNKAKVLYSPPTSILGGSESGETSWISHALSQEEFGIKELKASYGQLTSGLAGDKATEIVAASKFPIISPEFSNGAVGQVSLEAKGWRDTLAWRYYSNTTNYIAHTTNDDITKTIGEVAASRRILQQFTTIGEETVGWITLKLQKVGTPSDVEARVYSLDGSGDPSTLLATATFPASEIASTIPTWLSAELDTLYTFSAATQYGVVIQFASDTVDPANYVIVATDSGAGYSGGVTKEYNGSGWSEPTPAYDVAFQIIDKEETTNQISALLNSIGQFITGVSVLDDSGNYMTAYRDGQRTGIDELMDLLNMITSDGRQMILNIDRNLHAWIYKEPTFATTTADLLLPGNLLQNAAGFPISKATCPFGNWVRVKTLSDASGFARLLSTTGNFFVEGSEYDAIADYWSPTMRNTKSVVDSVSIGLEEG